MGEVILKTLTENIHAILQVSAKLQLESFLVPELKDHLDSSIRNRAISDKTHWLT